MSSSKDFARHTFEEDVAVLNGKTLKRIAHEEERGDTFVVLEFTDGVVCRLRYDWIYDFEIKRLP